MELKLDKRFIDEAVQEAVKDIKQNFIKKDVLDKIKTEIIQMPTISLNANDVYKADILAIIDKYKAESKDK